MRSSCNIYIGYGLLSALLFGAGTQLSKLMLTSVPPVTMAGLIYMGSGLGLLIMTSLMSFAGRERSEARLSRRDIPWLLGTMLFGTLLAPITLMFGLTYTPAATAALLLNFEGVATTIVAVLWVREPVGRRMWAALALIVTSCMLLSYRPDAIYGISFGALGVLLACSFWGIDNNVIQKLSGKNPITIVMLKGLCMGTVVFLISRFLGEAMPEPWQILAGMAIGFLFIGGLMSTCLMLAIRGLGSARGAAILSLSPFFGVVFAFLLSDDLPGEHFLLAFIIMVAGSYLLLTEKHCHEHTHPALTHEHRHRHDDLHHDHIHSPDDPPIGPAGYHSHVHTHETLTHTHPHSPDIHHRHVHGK